LGFSFFADTKIRHRLPRPDFVKKQVELKKMVDISQPNLLFKVIFLPLASEGERKMSFRRKPRLAEKQ